MTGLRYADVEYRDNEFMDLTSLTQDEFAELLPTFEAAFQERMQTYRLDGHQRTGRGYVTYANCPLPTRCKQCTGGKPGQMMLDSGGQDLPE